jgi:energy-coupling factor transporter ATP-binding protein EcfA2
MNFTYKGTRWFKCDLHLHTVASNCFQDRTVTPEQWVSRALEQGLDCVAVTDHNTGNMIDEIKRAAEGTKLTVFPGTEITCDTSKVHLLILFDPSKSKDDVNDFLIRCGVDREMFADQLASSTKSIFDVTEEAHTAGAIVIPAHIDEFNGLGSIGSDNLKKFFELPYINAVQVVHKDFTESSLTTNNNETLRTRLNEYYSNPTPPIDYTRMAEWHRPVKLAITQKLAIVTFSDNPHEPKNSKHGLDGIGTRFTWIKMDEKPTLEGLRQAFLLSGFRIKNDFESPTVPYQVPDLWFKSITIFDSTLNGTTPLRVDFSPQLNTIIGGRGSGKSSLLRFIRGFFNKTSDIAELREILQDHGDFYKREEGRPKKGVLKDITKIEIEFVRNSILHKIVSATISSSVNQTISIQRFNNSTKTWETVTDTGYIDFFEFEHYSQKQIYEIAQQTNSLRERIDKAIPETDSLLKDREVIKRAFLEKSSVIRTIQQQVAGKGKLETEIADLTANIGLLQQSGIADLLTTKNSFNTEEKALNAFKDEIAKRENFLERLIAAIDIQDIDYSAFQVQHTEQLKGLSQSVTEGIQSVKQRLGELKNEITTLKTDYNSALLGSTWITGKDTNATEFEQKKVELEQRGISDIANFESLSQSRSNKEAELNKILEVEGSLATERAERTRLQNEYLQKSKEITLLRKAFVNHMPTGNVKIEIKQFRNQNDFVQQIRKIVQREGGFQDDIDFLTRKCFNGNVERTIEDVRDIFVKIRKGERPEGISGHFINLIAGLNVAQVDELVLLLPEDEIEVQYRPTETGQFKSLSVASAGQKTTAILTFILSFGKVPLILDQPEDDLDNRLVYDLVVDRLKKAKDKRQIIVVTHNANIPVNGDAEYIISMSSDTNMLTVLHTGTVEQPVIKKEICDVMEGSEQAFQMRSMRYQNIGS